MKKVCAAVVAAAALSLAFAPAAMAGEGHGHGWHGGHGHHWSNGPLLVLLNGNNLNGTVGACGNNVGVLGAAVPINSPSITETCAAGGIVDEG
ncbi:hypothetical protein [Lentzea albidocapillata]|uniref:Small secreted domain n=2 Tax=Lentzea albidocapillata TaxID=40571 RepID=A0A1W2FK95_9PSEU|nr:hypothetical protein [Lentzea albidocapillata]SDK95662.1 hypothetical protein SAMN04488074_10886 [Lentzea albidocapillata subsp. violacea]SMD22330.1 hypothetical protein SAMN05660733_06760 [Lentzea albidocapillata]